MSVQTERVTINVKGNPMGAYLAKPEAPGEYPAVLVFMEIFGVNEHIQDVTRRIAEEGYVALAIDYYHRIAPGVELGYTDADVAQGRQYKEQVSADDILADARAAISFLQGLPEVAPKEKVGTIGFCFGGHLAFRVAELPEVAATASFYGGGIAHTPLRNADITVRMAGDIRGYMLMLFGEKDDLISIGDIHMIDGALQSNNIPHKVIVYPGAAHGFFCDQRYSYNETVAKEAWLEVKKLFARELKGVAVS